MRKYHKKDKLISFRFVVSREMCTLLCTGHRHTRSSCLILLMDFESACVSSHIQEKEKVSAVVISSDVLNLMCFLLDLGSKIKLLSSFRTELESK